jgi:hypothetical protein
VVAGGICAGQSLPTPQALSPDGGVVSVEAENRPPQARTTPKSPRLDATFPAILAVTASGPHCIAITPQKSGLCRGSLEHFRFDCLQSRLRPVSSHPFPQKTRERMGHPHSIAHTVFSRRINRLPLHRVRMPDLMESSYLHHAQQWKGL